MGIQINEKVSFTIAQKVSEVLSVLTIIFLFGYLILNWSEIPDKIPSHYNALGEVDRWSSKGSILILPIIGGFLYLVITLLSFMPYAWNIPIKANENNYIKVYENTRSIICYTKLIMLSAFTYITICTVKGINLGKWFTLIFLGLTFGVIIIFTLKIYKYRDKSKL